MCKGSNGGLKAQTKGLTAVIHFVAFGCSSQSYLLPLHRHFSAKKIRQPKTGSLIFPLFVPHLHTIISCVRSGLCIQNTASLRYAPQATFHCIPAILCLPPSMFSAVAPSHSHQGWHHSIKMSFCLKSRYA